MSVEVAFGYTYKQHTTLNSSNLLFCNGSALFAFCVCFHIALLASFCSAGDPFVYYDFEVSYKTVSPLGVPQQVIAINDNFHGEPINVTTNNNVVVNVKSKLDEDLLMTWSGVQQCRSSWQDGVPGTNCPKVVWPAMPQLTYRSKLPNILDSVIGDTMDLKRLYQVAAVAVLCVQPEPSYGPLITNVLHFLIPLVPIEIGGSHRVN